MEKVRDTIVALPRSCNVTSKVISTGKPGQSYISSGTIVNGENHTIVYDDSKRRGPVKKTRSCEHTVIARKHSAPHSWKYRISNLEWTYSSHPGWDYATPSIRDLVFSVDFSNCHSDALDFFKAGCVDQELDLGTNLFEFKQLFRTFDFLKGKIKRLSTVFKKGADAHLSYSFGIKPFVKDAISLFESLTALEEKVQWFRKNQGKLIPIRYSTDLTESFPGFDKVHASSNEHVLFRKENGRSLVYTAFALVRYDVSRLSDLELKLRTLTRATGLDNPLATAWELIPYSFLVDWVFNVGSFLGQLAPKISIPVQFIDQGWSVKAMLAYDDIIRFNNVSGTGLPWSFHRVRMEYYRRFPGIPVSLGAIAQTGDLSLRKLALGMSLAIQKV